MVGAPGGKARGTGAAGKAAPAGASLPAVRNNSRLTVLSGPSGVGKSTVVAELRRRSPEIWISVSVTTRSPRPGEVNGREYYFVDTAEFDRMVGAGHLLEWAEFAGAEGEESIGLAVHPHAGKEPGATIVLQVEDIEREHKRLETAGVKFEGKIEEIPGIVKLATFRDPSGNRLQLAQALMSS